MFRYVAHIDDVGLLAYSSAQFVHTNIPLPELFKFLPVLHAWKIASIHCIPAGLRCNKNELLMPVENHSCLQCSTHLTVFSVQMSKMPAIKLNSNKLNKIEHNVPASEESIVSEFLPEPADTDLTQAIL